MYRQSSRWKDLLHGSPARISVKSGIADLYENLPEQYKFVQNPTKYQEHYIKNLVILLLLKVLNHYENSAVD
jgi:hypothetical protein